MKLSSANRSEIQDDLSNKAFKYLASYTQIEKLTRKIDALKLVILDALKNDEDIKKIKKYIDDYNIVLKSMDGYGLTTKVYHDFLTQLYSQLEDLKNKEQ